MSLTTILLSVIALFISQTNSNFFKEVSISREKDFNFIQASSLSTESDNIIETYINKLTYYSTFALQSQLPIELEQLYVSSLENDQEIIAFEILEQFNSQIKPIKKYTNNSFLKRYDKSEKDFENQIKQLKLPYDEIFNGDINILNASTSKGIPTLWVSVPLIKDKKTGQSNLIISAFFRIEQFQASIQSSEGRQLFIVDKLGQIIAHTDQKKILDRTNQIEHPLVKDALNSELRLKQFSYTENNYHYIAAYSKTKFGPVAISEAPEEIILSPVTYAIRQGHFILGTVISLSLILIFLFSTTLTTPIEDLVIFTKKIAQGEFDLNITSHIKQKDEVGLLAIALDDMTTGLKERDKIKNVMDKFHGSAITEELIKSEVKRKGTRKDVVIFFSDIRGFTSFSEGKDPEEVVTMINEYMDMMVDIIYKYNGVVDKFVGDAIMAVWGIPHKSPDDSYNAVMATMEMRKKLVEFNQDRIDRGEQPLLTGIGLHTGSVVSGTVGSKDRMEYTIIGDTVNTAARIEASTKSFGSDLLISGELVEKVKERFLFELAGKSQVKGKTTILELYKVNGIKHTEYDEIIHTPYSSYEAEEDKKAKKVE